MTPLEQLKPVPRPNRLETVNLLQNVSSIGRSELEESVKTKLKHKRQQ